jgi:chemotaxis-related protein WspB
MLFVLFQLGHDRYALEAKRVVEIVPLLALKEFPQAPKGVAGVFIYRGQPVPAVDLCELMSGRRARERLSTRILVVNCAEVGVESREPRAEGQPSTLDLPRSTHQTTSPSQLLGLIAERATATMRCDDKEFKDVGVNLAATPYLGPVLMDDKGMIQLVHAQKLLAQNPILAQPLLQT